MWEEGSLSKTVTTGGEKPSFGFTCIICEETQEIYGTHWTPIVDICDNCKTDLKELVTKLRLKRKIIADSYNTD